MTLFSSVEREDVEPACPYFQGTGDRTCKSGCWQEPACVTGEPLGGYRKPQHNPPNPILISYRYGAAETQAERHEREMFISAEDEWLEYVEKDLIGFKYTPEHAAHARKVLERLAAIA